MLDWWKGCIHQILPSLLGDNSEPSHHMRLYAYLEHKCQLVMCFLQSTWNSWPLFSLCLYSAAVWTQLMSGFLEPPSTIFWEELMVLTIDNSQDILTMFLNRNGFQVSLHSLWCERNDRKYYATPTTVSPLVTMLDRHIQNRCSSFRELGDQKFAASLRFCLLATR